MHPTTFPVHPRARNVVSSLLGTAPAILCLLAGTLIPALAAPDLPPQGAGGLRPRLLVLTDIGGDPDDQQSLIRLMHYANEFDIEGLIASASGTPGELREKTTRPDLIREIVQAYGQVHGNLSRHARGYPPPADLLDRIKSGNPNRGPQVIGDGHDTQGSDWIIGAVDKPDTRPLNIAIWGGQTDLAQALWRVRHERGPGGLTLFLEHLRVYDIADQDDIAQGIWQRAPGIFYILNKAPSGQDRRVGAFRGLYLGGDESLVSRDWMETNIRQGHGPLAALYPPKTWTAPNPHSAIKEGDTPSWFCFLPHGLNHPAHPDWGGWGGRFRRMHDNVYRDALDQVGEVNDARATVWRWRLSFQSDFQARLDWCVAESFDQANHAPVAILNGDDTRNVLELTAAPGTKITLSAEGTRDPDSHDLRFLWWVYPKVGTYRDPVTLDQPESITTTLTAPRVADARSLHVILQVWDNGTPSLYAFRRVVLTVQPPK